MMKTETREIDGLEFTVQQLPATRGLKLLHKITAAIAPPIATALNGAEDLARLQDAKLELGAAVTQLFDRLPEVEFMAIVDALLQGALVTLEGKTVPLKPQLDIVLQGRLLTLLKLVAFAAEVNFSDFFGGRSFATIAASLQETVSRSKASATSTGPSTG